MEEILGPSPGLNTYTLWAFIGYLALIVSVGIYASRFSSKGINHFFIGGRQMSMLVVALSAVVSGRSAWLLLGYTGLAYSIGFSAIWAVAGYIIVEFFLFRFYAPRIRRFSEFNDCITIPDFFAERFGDDCGRLRALISAFIILFMVAYVSAQFVAGGKAFSASFGIAETHGLLLTTLIILFYTLVGGFLAVSLTDTIQGFFMLIALVVLPFMAVIHLGGPLAFWQEASRIDQGNFTELFALSAGALIGFLGIGLGSPGNPHIIARYMSIRDPQKLSTVAWVGTLMNILMAMGALVSGMAGRIYFPDVLMLPAGDPENLYPVLASQHLHPLMFGIVIASVFAAIMSTADSQLLVAASAVVRDIYEKILKRRQQIPQRLLVFYSRISVFLLVLLSLGLALLARDLIFWLVLFAWAGLGAAFGPTTILALFWKRTTRSGIYAGVITGALTVIIWNRIPMLKNGIYELVPAFLLAFFVTLVVSLLSSPTANNTDKYAQILKPNQKNKQ